YSPPPTRKPKPQPSKTNLEVSFGWSYSPVNTKPPSTTTARPRVQETVKKVLPTTKSPQVPQGPPRISDRVHHHTHHHHHDDYYYTPSRPVSVVTYEVVKPV